MIEINLLPEEMRKAPSRFKNIEMPAIDIRNIPLVKVAILFVGSVLLIQLIVFVIGALGKMNLDSIQKRYNSILPSKKKADTLKSQIDLINKKVLAIDGLMVNRFSWARELNALSDSMTPGIWLTSLSYDEKLTLAPGTKGSGSKIKNETSKASTEKVLLKYLVISGCASSRGEEGTALVGKFIKSLKDNNEFYKYFRDIELGSIKTGKIEDQEVMSFKITCFFKETE